MPVALRTAAAGYNAYRVGYNTLKVNSAQTRGDGGYRRWDTAGPGHLAGPCVGLPSGHLLGVTT